jgi:type VI secretion system protein ImpC
MDGMSKPISIGKIEVNVVSTMEENRAVPEPETPFRIAILGDFSGRANKGIFEPELTGQKPLLVDCDNINEVIAELGVEIHLPIAGSDISIRFTELDDFHPDRIFERLEMFQALRETRQKLEDSRTFPSAAAEVRGWTKTETAPEPGESPSEQPTYEPDISSLSSTGLLDQVLDKTQGRPPEAKPTSDASDWDAFLRKIVQPHLVPSVQPQQAELVAAVDASSSRLMRKILHHPDFQAIEAAWRGVHFLVSRLETGAELRLYLLDIAKAELAADLKTSEDLRSTGTYRFLVEQTVETPGGEPWAVLAGNYTFDETREDAELLGRLARIARQAGAPFISAAHPHILGCESLAKTPDPDHWRRLVKVEGSQAWEALRRLPEASYLGLALPRFLLRLPYGADTDPTEQFNFEEMPAEPHHDYYLWGNPSFACVCLLAQAFSHYGWDLRPGAIQYIEGLPLHIYKEHGDGETRVKPCAEVALTERAVESIIEKGIMPLLSFKNQDKVRLARFQSLANPPTNLIGRWG